MEFGEWSLLFGSESFLFPSCVQQQTTWGNQKDCKITCYFIGYFTHARLHNSAICPIPLRRSDPATMCHAVLEPPLCYLEVHAAVCAEDDTNQLLCRHLQSSTIFFQLFLSYHMCSACSFAAFGGTSCWTPSCIFLIVKCFHVWMTRVRKVSEWMYDDLVLYWAYVS